MLLQYHITLYQICITYQIGSVPHFGVVWFRYSDRSESAYLLKWAKMFTKLLTRRGLIHTNQILLSRNWLKRYLYDLSHMFFKRLKLVSGEIALQKCFVFYK